MYKVYIISVGDKSPINRQCGRYKDIYIYIYVAILYADLYNRYYRIITTYDRIVVLDFPNRIILIWNSLQRYKRKYRCF